MKTKDSNLFPSIEIHLLKQLENQYSASQSKCKNDFKEKDETESEFVTRVLGKNAHNVEDLFRTILIDEAHFLKNLVSYWGLGTALLGMSSQRSVPISGTPYNNGPQDMATLMTFIQPGIEPSKLSWCVNFVYVLKYVFCVYISNMFLQPGGNMQLRKVIVKLSPRG